MRNSSLVEAHVRAILISKRVTQEGEVQPYHQTELKVNVEIIYNHIWSSSHLFEAQVIFEWGECY